MFRPLTSVRTPARRRGALLIVVLSLLTLFALFGLFFVFYADAEATNARIAREVEANGDSGPPNDFAAAAFNYTLGCIVFDDYDTPNGVLNPLRGHSLGRSMYGWNGQFGPAPGEPFNGIGTFHEQAPNGIDRAAWINYSAPFITNTGPLPGLNTYFLDPEWTGYRLATEVGASTAPWLTGRSQAYVPKNASYTYPDLKDLILASTSPATGEVLVKSLHRDWLFDLTPPPNNPGGTPAQATWYDGAGRTRTLRPRPVDQLSSTELQSLIGSPTLPGTLTAAQANSLHTYVTNQIAAGQLIPYPPFNADGGYTGDVQNMMGGVGIQRNDSVLVDIGLAPRQWNGKWIKPLAAILVTDQDGKLNSNVHGNIRGGANAHASYAGYGPHEVNLGAVLGGEAQSVILARYGTPGNLNAAGVSRMLYDPSATRIPAYSQVNFDAGGVGGIFAPPAFAPINNAFQTDPTFMPGAPTHFDDNIYDAAPMGTDTYDKYLNHPLLFNPNDWPSGNAFRRTYPLSDLKRFDIRYAADRDWLAQTDIARYSGANTSLIGTSSGPGYRLDPAHRNRGLFTMLSTSHDRPGMAGNFNSSVGGGVLSLISGPAPGQWQLHPTNLAFTGTFTGAGSDYNSATDWRNPKAALGAIDLNRPLADYRADPSLPLSSTNAGNSAQAGFERHNLAKEIFARLIVATGANATVYTQTTSVGPLTFQPGDIQINATPGQPDYNALRYLAQLAANMVDLRDSDDVSTTFMWHIVTPPAPTPLNTLGYIPDSITFQTLMVQASTQAPSGVVYGVEKPRLVINEAIGEITNEPGETFNAGMSAQNKGRVRFWVELLNPTNAAYTGVGAATSPLGSGEAVLRVMAPVPYSPYQLQIIQRNGANTNDLTTPANVTGTMTPVPNGGLTFDFSTANLAAQQRIQPVGTSPTPYSSVAATGFLLVGPPDYPNVHTAGGNVEFVPNAAGKPVLPGNAIGVGPATSAMEYQLANMPPVSDLESVNYMQTMRQHTVLLRRLANPHLPPDPITPGNVYITVDVMQNVPAYDAVMRGGGPMDVGNRTEKAAAGITQVGFEGITNRFAVGKVQPYAGHSVLGAANMGDVTEIGTFAQNGSMVIRQILTVPNMAEPQHTFWRMNGQNAVAPGGPTVLPPLPAPTTSLSDTIMAPYDWFVHFDRPFVNQLELLSVQATKPHEVTEYFILPPFPFVVGQPIRRNVGLAPWLGMNPTTFQPGVDPTTGLSNVGLYRALDTLRVKPWMYGAALGGKVHGKINLNAIQDPRVLAALLDGNDAGGLVNGFSNATNVNFAWQGSAPVPGFITNAPGAPLPGSRTVNSRNSLAADGVTSFVVPVPGQTYDDVPNPTSGGPYDRPIRSFGTAEFIPDGSNMAYAARNGSGLQDTIFRVNTVPATPTFGSPLLSVSSQTHPYMQAEMVRKMFNNATTTSNVFSVTVTIVFHEVRIDSSLNPMFANEGPGNRYLIGREAYKEIPGDLRQQFYSVVDRSNIAMQLQLSGLPGPVQGQPLFASLGQAMFGTAPGQTVAMVDATASNPNLATIPMLPGEMNPPTGSYNVYLADAIPVPSGTARPYTTGVNAYTVQVYADGKPVTIGAGNVISLGTGLTRETLIVNYVNADGSLNIGDPSNVLGLGVRPAPAFPHAVGELASNASLGNPGPVNPGNGNNPGPFDPINPSNLLYRGVVPYAQRVR